MINKKNLLQFYVEQYANEGNRKPKKPPRAYDIARKSENLRKTLRSAKPSRVNVRTLEELHRQVKTIAGYAHRKKQENLIKLVNEEFLPKLMELDLGVMLTEQRDGVDGECLEYLRRTCPGRICQESLFTLYPEFRRYKVKNKIVEMVPTRPEMEFPEVRLMCRNFVLHVGPTNSGKTYQALEKLKTAKNGVYLGPLRLLALEVYEQMNKSGVPCTMLTGQECIAEENSRVTASTVEMADFDGKYDIAVIDEAQMVTDPDRGHSWTKAILGIRADEIHICMSPAAEPAVIHLIELCGDTYVKQRYERKTELVCEEQPFRFPEDVREGDALIAFSKKSVLDVAGRLEESKIDASVIYGSLPPEIRRRQMHRFNQKLTKVVVATDVIGMGLNLPVRRIVFLQADKYDGTNRRPLQPPEVKQIAGRAGRFGIYDTGYVTAMGEKELQFIKECCEVPDTPIEEVNLGFPQILLDIDGSLDEIMRIWRSEDPSYPFVKENIDEALYLYEQARKCKDQIDDFGNKHTLYKMITCPIDIKDKQVVSLWLEYCKTYTADVSLEKPDLWNVRGGGIQQYETYYKQLDLYYQFSNRMQKVIDEEWLDIEREGTELRIMRYLTKGKRNYIARCRYCGKQLHLGDTHRLCDDCRQKKAGYVEEEEI